MWYGMSYPEADYPLKYQLLKDDGRTVKNKNKYMM